MSGGCLSWRRSLGAKVALHVGVFHGGAVRKIVADAGSAGGNTSSTAVLDGFDGDMSVAQRLQSFGALLERPSNLHALCAWLLVRGAPLARIRVLGRFRCLSMARALRCGCSRSGSDALGLTPLACLPLPGSRCQQ